MKPTAAIQTRPPEPVATSSQTRFSGWGWLILCPILLALGACQPGEDGAGIDPGIVEIPIAYIKRPIPVDDQGDEVQADVREPELFSSGGDVYLRSGSDETNITRSVTAGIGDVKGLNASHDGTKLIFSLRLFDPNPNNAPFPSWNIYEYDLETSQLRMVISSALTAEEGDDLYPAYLPDGRIVFTSNRQRQAREMLVNEGRPRYSALDEDEGVQALVLHVMNADGSDIHQISFNQSHDLYPQVLTNYQNGRVVSAAGTMPAATMRSTFIALIPTAATLRFFTGRAAIIPAPAAPRSSSPISGKWKTAI